MLLVPNGVMQCDIAVLCLCWGSFSIVEDIVSILLIEKHILLVFKAGIICFIWAVSFVNKHKYVNFDEFTCIEKSVKQCVMKLCWNMIMREKRKRKKRLVVFMDDWME